MKSSRLNATKSRAKVWVKIAGIYVGIILGLEGIGQLYVRYLESKKPSGIEAENLMSYQEPVVGFGLKKNLSVNLSSWHVHTDRWGFRGTEAFEREKPANEKRIFLVGGSTVFGWGVNEDQSLQWFLDTAIGNLKSISPASDTKIRVINAGVPWYASWHEAAQIMFKVMEFSPDAIVVLDGLNDTAMGIASSWTPLYLGYVDRPTQLAYERKKQGEHSSFLLDLFRISPTFSYFEARYKEKQETKTGVYRPEVWDQYLGIMNRLYSLTRAQNIPIHFFYQPVQAIDKPTSYYEQTHNGTSMAKAEFEATFKKEYLEGERRVLASGLPLHSLKSVFQGNARTIYLDGLHYNSAGNDVIANSMWQFAVRDWVKQWIAPPTRQTASN